MESVQRKSKQDAGAEPERGTTPASMLRFYKPGFGLAG
jgi:hypothetical protein